MCKRLFFLILLFSKNDQILNSKHMTCVIYIYQNIWPVKYTSLINSIIPEPNVRFFLSYDIRTMKTHSLQKTMVLSLCTQRYYGRPQRYPKICKPQVVYRL